MTRHWIDILYPALENRTLEQDGQALLRTGGRLRRMTPGQLLAVCATEEDQMESERLRGRTLRMLEVAR